MSPIQTPIVQLYSANGVQICAKQENLQLTGSVKYRVANTLIEAAEKLGHLGDGSKIIEESSGNTGIGLACAGREKGYPVTIVVSKEGCTQESREIMKRYGASVIPVEGWIKERHEFVKDMLLKDKSYFWTQQVSNPAALRSATNLGKEMLQQFNAIGKDVDYFLACTGTGATITGVGRTLKEKNHKTRVIAVVPGDFELPCVDDYRTYEKLIPLLDKTVIDDNFIINDEVRIHDAMKELHRSGYSVGFSSAAVFYAAQQLAKQEKGTILVIFPDSGDRYDTMRREKGVI